MHVALVRALAAVTVMLCIAAGPTSADERVKVVLETSLGRVVLAIDTQKAPEAASYFLGYVDRGQYDGAHLYRSASLDKQPEPQLIQGGILLDALNSTAPIDPSQYGVSSLLPKWETTADTGLRHTRGSLSLARDLLATGHVIPELVVCLRDIPRMDATAEGSPDAAGFPVIGEVLTGMDIMDAVSHAELKGETNIAFLNGQILSKPISISQAYRE